MNSYTAPCWQCGDTQGLFWFHFSYSTWILWKPFVWMSLNQLHVYRETWMDAWGLVFPVNKSENVFQGRNSPLHKTMVDIASIPSLKSTKLNLCAGHLYITLIHLKLLETPKKNKYGIRLGHFHCMWCIVAYCLSKVDKSNQWPGNTPGQLQREKAGEGERERERL